MSVAQYLHYNPKILVFAERALMKLQVAQPEGEQVARSRDPHSNNLNAIRLLLACLVVLSHSFVLSRGDNSHEPLWLLTHGQETFGMVAVELFFLISGMLITASWFRSRSMEDFIYKRVLRIYPAFITAIIFSAALIWIWCPEFRNTVAIRGWGQSLIHDSLFLTHGSLVGHGIFAANPFQGEANGSLWTINIEFSCYLLVAVLGMFCVFKHRTALLTIGAAIWIYYVAGLRFGGYTQRPYGRFLTFFLAGMLVWLYRDKVRFSPRIALCCLIAIVASANLRPVFSAIFPIAGSYIILWIGLQPSARFVRWTDDRDLSYGVYLFAFPIEQVVASIPALRSPGIILGIALPIALALAAVSWRFIERPALRLKSRKFCDYDPGAPKEVPRAQRLPESFGENLQPAASE